MTVRLYNVHDPARCAGRPCCVHAPSNHALRDWPQRWHADRRFMERVCSHGIGHPDPDQLSYLRTLPSSDDGYGVHGCDGCCGAAERVRHRDADRDG